MTHFVALVASERKKGNSDLLARLTTRYALRSGADSAEIIYLKDFQLEQCLGCMSCTFNQTKCRIEDDLYRLLDIIMDADKLLLIAPVYVLSIPGKLKMFIDRYLAITNYIKERKELPAVSIGIAALPDWHQFQLPLMNIGLLGLGRIVVDSFILYGAGPGEVLIHPGIERVQKAVKNLIQSEPEPLKSQISKHCPVDFCTLFERIDDNHYRCPVCLSPAQPHKDGFYFDAVDLNSHRWTRENIKKHFIDWILQTKPRFFSNLKKIIEKKREFEL